MHSVFTHIPSLVLMNRNCACTCSPCDKFDIHVSQQHIMRRLSSYNINLLEADYGDEKLLNQVL